jgi:hypothetical protein
VAGDSKPPTYLAAVGEPEFIDELEQHHGYPSLLNGDLNSLRLVLTSDDTRTLFVQFQDAIRSLWHMLALLPEQVGATSEADFILGFTPNAALPYEPGELGHCLAGMVTSPSSTFGRLLRSWTRITRVTSASPTKSRN